ncbi:hypothetical protein AB0O91_00910 [Kitasatospora sp. NPDC089797]|uniref:hypothetical protein n=1 Tax=Kitasatospora sp. NPDC089797 TaxID=3155298 RepID=UPI00341EF777
MPTFGWRQRVGKPGASTFIAAGETLQEESRFLDEAFCVLLRTQVRGSQGEEVVAVEAVQGIADRDPLRWFFLGADEISTPALVGLGAGHLIELGVVDPNELLDGCVHPVRPVP